MTTKARLGFALVFVMSAAAIAWAADNGFRTWTDKTGKHKIEASFVKYEKGKAYIKKKSDGKVTAVPMAQLSSADQAHVRKLLRDARKNKKKTQPPTSTSNSTANAAGKMSWAGTWNNRKFGTKGPLVATVTPKSDGKTWQATFTGTGIGKPFKYEVEIKTTKKDNKTILTGESRVDGDRYQWNGHVQGKDFYGRYRSASGNNGEFKLVEKRPTR